MTLSDGRPAPARLMRHRHRDDLEEAGSRAHFAAPGADELMACLNSLPSHRFTEMLSRLPSAVAWAAARPSADYFLRALDLLRERPQPVYAPTERSSRLFAVGGGLQNLPKDLRRILCPGWVEADLASAHLAIVAREWGIPSIERFLRAGRSIWAELCALYGVDPDADEGKRLKRALKYALYALVYGDNVGHVKTELRNPGITRHFRAKGQGQPCRAARLCPPDRPAVDNPAPFFGHEVVRALLEARGREIERIHRQGFALDVFGREVRSFRAETSSGPRLHVPSILSQVSQATELALLLPVLEVARTAAARGNGGFTITLWQHDGFSIAPHRRNRLGYWQEQMNRAVAAKASELGVVTRLTWD